MLIQDTVLVYSLFIICFFFCYILLFSPFINILQIYLAIIPWAHIGYEMVNSQQGPWGRFGYNQSHIQQVRME